MKIVYLGVSDLYLPATAAALHLGLLEPGRYPELSNLRKIPHFRPVCKEDDGKLAFVGSDSKGNDVYIACIKAQPYVIVQGVESLLGVYQIPQTAVRVVPCVTENPQIALLNRMLTAIRLQDAAYRLAGIVVHNRFRELKDAALH